MWPCSGTWGDVDTVSMGKGGDGEADWSGVEQGGVQTAAGKKKADIKAWVFSCCHRCVQATN